MKDYLLSIFPLQGIEPYARVSCVVLEDSSFEGTAPFTTSRSELAGILSGAFLSDEAEAILTKLDLGNTVQVPVTTLQATMFGFIPKVN